MSEDEVINLLILIGHASMGAQSDLSEARPIYPPKIIKLKRFALQKPVKVGEVGEKALY